MITTSKARLKGTPEVMATQWPLFADKRQRGGESEGDIKVSAFEEHGEEQMRAYIMNQPGSLGLTHWPDPVFGCEEVLLQTESVTICSTDVSYFRGYLFPDRWPIVPGHEYVGRIIDIGAQLRGKVAIGQRLCYWGQTDFGGMAEYRVIRPIFGCKGEVESSWQTERNFYDADQSAAVVVPESLVDTATIIEPLTSVLRSVLRNRPRPGDRCVVLGCGPCAILATQVLTRYLGVRSILAVDQNEHRLKVALAYGAERGFNTATKVETLERFVHSNRDRYADYVFDALPHVPASNQSKDQNGTRSPDPRELGMSLLRPGGTYVLFGAAGLPQQINTWLILAKGLTIKATPFDVRLFPMARSAQVAKTALRLMESGLIDPTPLITQEIPFDDSDAVRSAFGQYGQGSSMKACLRA